MILKDELDPQNPHIKKDQLEYAFEKILKTLHGTDWFMNEAPSVFVVYAHDNPASGDADSSSVKDIIRWLGTIGPKVLSDQAPLCRLWTTAENGNNAAHDVVDNQLRLLPATDENQTADNNSSVDKVIICSSEVLHAYYKDKKAAEYIDNVVDCYSCSQNKHYIPSIVRNKIKNIVWESSRQKWFHHVLTELAFLKIRFPKGENNSNLVPIVLNSGDISVFPFFDKSQPVRLEVKSSEDSIKQIQARHNLFFKLIARLYEDRHEIREFKTCYEKCVNELCQETSQHSQDTLEVFINQSIRKTLKRVNSDALADVRNSSQKRRRPNVPFLDKLWFFEMNHRQRDVEEPIEGMSTWITDDESYAQWVESDSGILGLRGNPGSGKSTIMKQILTQLKSEEIRKHLEIAFFYHRRGNNLQYSEIGMYRTLLYQLLQQVPSAGSKFEELAEEQHKANSNGDAAWEWRLPDLKTALRSALNIASKHRRIRLIIDAIDEAGTEHAGEVIRGLTNIHEELRHLGTPVSICFSSRHFPNLPPTETFTINVNEKNKEDISRYISAELQCCLNFERTSEMKKLELLKQLCSELQTKASGNFLWVALIVKLVAKEWNYSESLRDTLKTLDTLPLDLDEMYRHIFTEVVNQARLPDTLHLIQWILLAETPLSVTELRYALSSDDRYYEMPSEQEFIAEIFAEDDESMEALIKSLTGGLAEVRVHDERVQFIHQTINDFLVEDDLKCLREMSEEAIGNGHDRLVRSCINYLILNKAKFQGNYSEAWVKDKFIDYSSTYSFIHAQQAERRGISQKHLIARFMPLLKEPPLPFIVSHMCCEVEYGATLLQTAAYFELTSVVEELIQHVDVEETDEEGNTALHYAAKAGHASILTILLKNNAAPGTENNHGETALGEAACHGHNKIIKLLFEVPGYLTERDKASALIQAAASKRISSVKLLLQNKVDINAHDKDATSPLQAAAFSGSKQVIQLLLEAGADVNAQGGDHGNALQAAAFSGSKQVIQLLLEAGADVNAQGGEYGNALQAAVSSDRHKEVVQLLLEAGADVNVQGGMYGNALQAAAYGNSIKVMQLLLKAGADVNAQGGEYGSALKAALSGNSQEIVQLLLEAGADVNAQGGDYGNALQAAVYNSRSKKVLQLLLKAGADVNAQGGEYGSALQLAEAGQKEEIVELLLEAGAYPTY